MPFYIVKGDLVEMNVDAIVNPSNVNLRMVEGVGRAIFHKAGDLELSNCLKSFKRCEVGKSVETPPFNMKNCKILIHTVAPIYINGKHGEKKNLISSYNSAFKILKEHDYHSIAFPLLSADFNYPYDEAYAEAKEIILNYLKENKNDVVYIVVYKNFPNLVGDEFQSKLTHYITSVYKTKEYDTTIENSTSNNNKAFVEEVRSFQRLTDTDDDKLIFDGNLSQQLFDRLVNDESFIPSKNACVAFAIAMKLNLKQTKELLNSCGYEFKGNNLFDLIVSYFLNYKIYNVYQLNESLFRYGINPVGADF